MRSTLTRMIPGIALLTTLLLAQEPPGRKIPSVTMSPVGIASVTRGKPNSVDLRFHVSSGFHVNSNKPTAEYLIPTALKLDAPTDIVLGGITYPDGQLTSFAFAPDEKLSVYSGEFDLAVMVRPLASVLPGDYEFHGQLKYQACDNAACYPPKQLPVRFVVKVVKAPPPHRKNPAQSPHIHN
jgi:Disulphide bond corrector protein DsbC